ncbi:O-antigen ligase family protein [Providencia sp. PROV064]|uniref:O-antigen ligase family protein n=1 Tax=Providencia sp. PROV064 TaxID=2949790 RepID=UPI00234B7A19|nr:O-antigen ligase family protein [Providencia sp. PROV064]
MNIKNYIISQFPFLLVSLVILGMFTNDTQGVLNISAVLLFLYTVYTIIKNKINIKDDLIQLVRGRKVFFLFSLWCILCAIFFTYSQFTLEALKEFFNDWRYVIIITLFLIAFRNNESKSIKTISYALIATLAFTLFISPILKQFKDSDLPLFLQLRYGFAHYTTLLFPFTFAALFIFKNNLLKVAMFILSIFAFCFLLYTGSRGGVLAVVIETLIILFLFSQSIKKFTLYIVIFAIASLSVTTIAYTTIPQVKNKINQTLDAKNISSSRDKIVMTRFPIFMNQTKNILFGVGYGSVSYNQYLNDNNAERFRGGGKFSQRKNEYVHNNDDPFFLNILYNVGLGGLLLFTIAYVINLKDLMRNIKSQKNILNVGIFASSIGYFLIYCLFEFIFLDIFFLYNILVAILINQKRIH